MIKTKAYEILGSEWANYLWLELNTYEFKKLTYKIQNDRDKNIQILPNKEDIFKAFRLTSLSDVKVVILSDEPYNNTYWDNSPVASGLAFGVSTVIPSAIPTSLKNIIKEIEDDLELSTIDFDYTLQSWVKQGVLLLNTALTVQKGNAGSHNVYWQPFTKRVMEVLNTYTSNTIFILLGSNAKSFKQYLDNPTFKFVESDDIINSKIFSKTNNYLKESIIWNEYVN